LEINVETIILSIRPEYAERILNGEKWYEYRRRIARKPIGKIVIYATFPIMRILGEVGVKNDILAGCPSTIWEQTKNHAGISRSDFRRYFKNRSTAYAYCLVNAIRYKEPLSLTDFGIVSPPQSFIYLRNSGEI
jgi:predicted transcriptional regulator